ncbi:MAG: Asp23/Gls24 family envelope stress response protein [Lachnospiraceae bacterium]|nr:Asp23/Gls24 family envelope stress response protein [Lachnospiraceae bacterium]
MPMESLNISNDTDFVSEVKISNDVIATVAALAATEVEGVDSLSGNATNDSVKRYGIKNGSKGVEINFNDEGRSVNCRLGVTMKFGYSIPETCALVQDKVKSAIESMIGLDVTDISINIGDVNVNR